MTDSQELEALPTSQTAESLDTAAPSPVSKGELNILDPFVWQNRPFHLNTFLTIPKSLAFSLIYSQRASPIAFLKNRVSLIMGSNRVVGAVNTP